MHFLRNRFVFVSMMIVLLLLTACGSQNAADLTPTITPTTFPTFAVSQPTEAPQIATAAAATAVAATEIAASGEIVLDTEKVERGLGRYEALECAACHGVEGEGTDDGPTLVDYSASLDEFIDFMRTGGELGESHRYPAERLSPGGAENLYHYVVSLE